MRIAAAVLGGYALANLASVLLARLLPLPRGEAVMTALLISFVFYTLAIIWSFAAHNVMRAWCGLLLPIIVSAISLWLLGNGSAV